MFNATVNEGGCLFYTKNVQGSEHPLEWIENLTGIILRRKLRSNTFTEKNFIQSHTCYVV